MRFTLSAILLVFLLFSSPTIHAQTELEEAKIHLQKLSKGMLLVRLQTDSLKITFLEELGRKKEADQVRKAVYQEQREIILSFKKTFHFCPVYFFYSSQTSAIQNGKLYGHIFDHNLELVENDSIPKIYYTAKFAKTENLGINALVIMDNYLIALKAPFPFYQRQYLFFSLFKQSKAAMAERLNKRLFQYAEIW